MKLNACGILAVVTLAGAVGVVNDAQAEEPMERTESQIVAAINHDLSLLVEALTNGDRQMPELIPRRALAPQEGASERRRLMVDRYNTAAVECAASLVRFPNVPATDVVASARRLRNAEREMSPQEARIAVQRKYWELIRFLEQQSLEAEREQHDRLVASGVKTAEQKAATYHAYLRHERLDAEILLLQMQDGK